MQPRWITPGPLGVPGNKKALFVGYVDEFDLWAWNHHGTDTAVTGTGTTYMREDGSYELANDEGCAWRARPTKQQQEHAKLLLQTFAADFLARRA